MKARIRLNEGVSFIAESGSGHTITTDGAPDAGGKNLGPRPMELLLMGTGACSAFDVMLILRRGRQDVQDCVVELEAERAESDPKVFTHIHLNYTLTGNGLDSDRVARAIQLSSEKYCSASAMLARTARITHNFTIVDMSLGADV
ncbi:MAG: OsmC family protein [Betaproteobacteria bacterium]|nr:OsmC family protein [Betaproteobacteria bacterium]